MKLRIIVFIAITATLIGCSLNEDAGTEVVQEETVIGFEGVFIQQDRIGKPGINVALILENRRELFNRTMTKYLQRTFSEEVQNRIVALSPAYASNTDTNILGQTSGELAEVFANDVLEVSLTGPTTFNDGTTVLTGRNLEDDVIDTTVLWIYGGEDGTENSQLTKDNVSENDRAFQATFPYVAKAW